MRKLLTLSLLCVSLSFTTAQVAIDDPGMIQALQTVVPNAMNGFELDEFHPDVLAVTNLDISGFGIEDLNGVQYFLNVLEFDCSNNLITSLDPLPPAIIYLYASGNLINEATLPSTVVVFNAWANDLQSLLLDPLGDLTDLHLSENGFTVLPDLPDGLHYLDIRNNPLTGLDELPSDLQYLDIRTVTGITCLPELPDQLIFLYAEDSGVECLPNIPASLGLDPDDLGFGPVLCDNFYTYCVEPNILGATFTDANNNGVRDIGESPQSLTSLAFQPGNWTTGSSINGEYGIHVPTGTYTIEALPGPYQSVTTGVLNANIPDLNTVETGKDHGIYTPPGIQDLVVDLTCNGQPRPSEERIYTLTYSHPGSDMVSGTITLQMDPAMSFVGAVPVPDDLNGNTATWNYSNLAFGQGGQIFITLETIFGTALGYEAMHTASILPMAGDLIPVNNVDVLEQMVVGSYDPNDKLAEPGSMQLADIIAGGTIDYTIRFQNTGNAPAYLVRITDTLSTQLIWDSFEFVSSSHSCQWFEQNGVLTFLFEDINLPDSTSDAAGSQGFVKFRIQPSDLLLEGAQVFNTANIYFDFNEPIITDPAVFEVSMPTAIAEEATNDLMLWPNPTNNVLWVQVADRSMGQIEVLDISGKQLLSVSRNSELSTIDLRELDSGSYVIRYVSEQGVLTKAFMKQ